MMVWISSSQRETKTRTSKTKDTMTYELYKAVDRQYNDLRAEVLDAKFVGWNATDTSDALKRFVFDGIEDVQSVQIPTPNVKTGKLVPTKLPIYVSRDTLQMIVDTGDKVNACIDDTEARRVVSNFARDYTRVFYERYKQMPRGQQTTIRAQTKEKGVPKDFLNYDTGVSTNPKTWVWEIFFIDKKDRYANMRESLEVVIGLRDRVLEIEPRQRDVGVSILALQEENKILKKRNKELQEMYGDDTGQHAIVEGDGMVLDFAA